MGRVIHFEIPADSPERATAFYTGAFGWQVQTWGGPEPYWLLSTGPDSELGINGAITRRNASVSVTTNTVDVASWEKARDQIVKAGGNVLTPKIAVPGIGWMAYCQDTEGNVFGIMQTDKTAKRSPSY